MSTPGNEMPVLQARMLFIGDNLEIARELVANQGIPYQTELLANKKIVPVGRQAVTLNPFEYFTRNQFGINHTADFAYKNANIIVIHFDLEDAKSFANVRQWIEEAERYGRDDAQFVIVGLQGKSNNNSSPVDRDIAKDFAEQVLQIPYIEQEAGEDLGSVAEKIFKETAKLTIDRQVPAPVSEDRITNIAISTPVKQFSRFQQAWSGIKDTFTAIGNSLRNGLSRIGEQFAKLTQNRTQNRSQERNQAQPAQSRKPKNASEPLSTRLENFLSKLPKPKGRHRNPNGPWVKRKSSDKDAFEAAYKARVAEVQANPKVYTPALPLNIAISPLLYNKLIYREPRIAYEDKGYFNTQLNDKSGTHTLIMNDIMEDTRHKTDILVLAYDDQDSFHEVMNLCQKIKDRITGYPDNVQVLIVGIEPYEAQLPAEFKNDPQFGSKQIAIEDRKNVNLDELLGEAVQAYKNESAATSGEGRRSHTEVDDISSEQEPPRFGNH